jgi:hypothetical protein
VHKIRPPPSVLEEERNAGHFGGMNTNATSIDVLTSLIAQQEKTRLARHRIRRSIDRLEKKDSKLRDHEFALQNQIHEHRIRQSSIQLPTSAAPSPKNLDFLRAWSALHSELKKLEPGAALSQNACRLAIRRAVIGIADATVRSQLHRLKSRGFIEKIGGGWRLVSTDETAGAVVTEGYSAS